MVDEPAVNVKKDGQKTCWIELKWSSRCCRVQECPLDRGSLTGRACLTWTSWGGSFRSTRSVLRVDCGVGWFCAENRGPWSSREAILKYVQQSSVRHTWCSLSCPNVSHPVKPGSVRSCPSQCLCFSTAKEAPWQTPLKQCHQSE